MSLTLSSWENGMNLDVVVANNATHHNSTDPGVDGTATLAIALKCCAARLHCVL